MSTIPGTEVIKVPAREVKEGDFIPGLDNGYVIAAEPENGFMVGTDRYSFAQGEGTVTITMNDAEGDEFYLMAPLNMPITIAREVSA